MTDGLDTALVEAGLDLLRADTALVVHHTVVPPNTRPPYVVVYARVDWPIEASGNSLDGLATSPTVRWYCHCVGETGEAAIALGERVRAQLLNQRFAVAGLDVGLIRQEAGGGQPQRNEATGSPRVDQVVVYRAGAVS